MLHHKVIEVKWRFALYLLLLTANTSFAQFFDVSKVHSTEVFIQSDSGTFFNDRKVRFKIPNVDGRDSLETVELYSLGVNLGSAYRSTYVVGCFKLTCTQPVDSIPAQKRDSLHWFPFSALNISDVGEISYLEVYSSQKPKRSWLRKEKKLHLGNEIDIENALKKFETTTSGWSSHYMHLSEEYDFSKPVYIYIVVRNPKDRVVLHFNNLDN